MGLLRKSLDEPGVVWRQCLECGDRFRVPGDAKTAWCSSKCENSALRRQRDRVETTWIRATWFLR